KGLPFGKVIEIFGEEQVGKTLFGLLCMAEAQKQGAICTFYDGEYATVNDSPRKLVPGLDLGAVVHPDVASLEDMFDSVEMQIDETTALLKKAKVDVPQFMLVDSLPSYPLEEELSKRMDEGMASAVAARVIRLAWRKLMRKIAHERVIVMFTNHETANIRHGWAPPGAKKWTTYGGTGGRFGASVRLRLQTAGFIKSGTNQVGVNVITTIFKNRFERPMTKIEYPIYWDRGIDNAAAMVRYMITQKALDEEVFPDGPKKGKKTGKYLVQGEAFERTSLLARLHSDAAFLAAFKAQVKPVFQASRVMAPGGTESTGEVTLE